MPNYGFDRSGAQRIADQTRNHVPPDASNSREPLGVRTNETRDRDVIFVVNKTDQELQRGNIVALGKYVNHDSFKESEFRRRPHLEGLVPSVHRPHRFGVVLETIRKQKPGKVVASGCIPCRVDMADRDHEYCQLKPNSVTELVSVASGPAEILWREGDTSGGSPTGVQHCFIKIGAPPSGAFGYIIARLKADMTPTDWRVDGEVIHIVGDAAGLHGAAVEEGQTVSLMNSVQTFNGIEGDYCIAIPRPYAIDAINGFEIFVKPCHPNNLNSTTLFPGGVQPPGGAG